MVIDRGENENKENEWVVKTSDGIVTYTTHGMKEIYNVDMNKSDLERVGWVS